MRHTCIFTRTHWDPLKYICIWCGEIEWLVNLELHTVNEKSFGIRPIRPADDRTSS